jgi:hypothetical protein
MATSSEGSEPRYEVRPHPDEDRQVLGIDVVVVHKPEYVHIERMDNGVYWVGIDMPDGTRIAVWFTAQGKAPARFQDPEDGVGDAQHTDIIKCDVDVEDLSDGRRLRDIVIDAAKKKEQEAG